MKKPAMLTHFLTKTFVATSLWLVAADAVAAAPACKAILAEKSNIRIQPTGANEAVAIHTDDANLAIEFRIRDGSLTVLAVGNVSTPQYHQMLSETLSRFPWLKQITFPVTEVDWQLIRSNNSADANEIKRSITETEFYKILSEQGFARIEHDASQLVDLNEDHFVVTLSREPVSINSLPLRQSRASNGRYETAVRSGVLWKKANAKALASGDYVYLIYEIDGQIEAFYSQKFLESQSGSGLRIANHNSLLGAIAKRRGITKEDLIKRIRLGQVSVMAAGEFLLVDGVPVEFSNRSGRFRGDSSHLRFAAQFFYERGMPFSLVSRFPNYAGSIEQKAIHSQQGMTKDEFLATLISYINHHRGIQKYYRDYLRFVALLGTLFPTPSAINEDFDRQKIAEFLKSVNIGKLYVSGETGLVEAAALLTSVVGLEIENFVAARVQNYHPNLEPRRSRGNYLPITQRFEFSAQEEQTQIIELLAREGFITLEQKNWLLSQLTGLK